MVIKFLNMNNIFHDGTENSAAKLVEEYWKRVLVWSLPLLVVLYLLLKGRLCYWLHYVAVLVILTRYLPLHLAGKHPSDKVEDQHIQIFGVHCYFLCS